MCSLSKNRHFHKNRHSRPRLRHSRAGSSGIQSFQYVLDPPVKSDADLREESLRPEDDKLIVFDRLCVPSLFSKTEKNLYYSYFVLLEI